MPWKDPGMPGWLATIAGHAFAPALAFAVSLVRAIHAGGQPMKSFLEAIMVGLVTVGLAPLFRFLEMPELLSVFAGAVIAFMGVEWLRSRIDALAKALIDRWGPK